MSTQPSILNLRLDANWDLIFDPDAQLSNLEAVVQAINTRLRLFQSEWWSDLNDGTPFFQEIIGKRATPNALQVMALALSERVSGTPFVQLVENAAVSFNSVTRIFSFSCTAQTAFGTVQVVFSPGLNANIGQ